jgi:hypothetical protein
MSRSAIAVLLALSVCVVHAEEPGTDTPYRKYYEQLGPAKAADPGNALRIRLCPQPLEKGDALPADLAFELRDGTEHTPMPLDAKRCFELPANAQWAEHDAVLHKNSSRKLRAVVDITGALPASTQLSYAELTASVPAFARVIAAQGVMARMFGPKANGLEIAFAPGASQAVIVHAATGDIRYASDEHGVIHMPVDPKLNDARVELSSLPVEIGPDVSG